jgi:tetratricopeptide (TPR) repeat protein
MGVAQGNTGSSEDSVQSLKKAMELKDRASELERFYISGHYFAQTGDLDKSIDLYEQWHKQYPRDTIPINNLSIEYAGIGEFDEQLSLALEEMRLEPDSSFSYQDLSDAYRNENRLAEARAVAEQSVAKKVDSAGSHRFLYASAALRKDQAAMNHELEVMRGKPNEEYLLELKGIIEVSQGQLKQAQTTWREARSLGEKSGRKEFAVQSDEGKFLALTGDCAAARSAVAASLQDFPSGDNRVPSAIALAFCGDEAKARALMDSVAKEYPSDTFIHSAGQPLFEAILETRKGQYDDAMKALDSARRFDLNAGPGRIPFQIPYFRGLAFLKKADGELAAAEFQKILDHSYIRTSSYFLPLARLQLARAYVLQKDKAKAKAKTTYQDFLALWKDADPDIPILKQAKAEYAKLQ